MAGTWSPACGQGQRQQQREAKGRIPGIVGVHPDGLRQRAVAAIANADALAAADANDADRQRDKAKCQQGNRVKYIQRGISLSREAGEKKASRASSPDCPASASSAM